MVGQQVEEAEASIAQVHVNVGKQRSSLIGLDEPNFEVDAESIPSGVFPPGQNFQFAALYVELDEIGQRAGTSAEPVRDRYR